MPRIFWILLLSEIALKIRALPFNALAFMPVQFLKMSLEK
jgi:hypothetical protein